MKIGAKRENVAEKYQTCVVRSFFLLVYKRQIVYNEQASET